MGVEDSDLDELKNAVNQWICQNLIILSDHFAHKQTRKIGDKS